MVEEKGEAGYLVVEWRLVFGFETHSYWVA